MNLRLGVTNDADMAPLFFPVEAGWVTLPTGTVTKSGLLADLEKELIEGSLDVSPVTPLTYANNLDLLRILPTPVRAFELAADSVFLISTRRLDRLDKVRVAISPNSAMGEVILKIIASSYYGVSPDTTPVPSEAAALEALQGKAEACVISSEAAMRAVGWAKSKNFFVEDITKAWWIMTGLPLPLYLFAVRRDWTEREPNAPALARNLMLSLRSSIQYSNDQRPTLLSRVEARTGLPADALENHFRAQRYDLNEGHLRGLLEFYRRAASLKLLVAPDDLAFFPALSPLAAAPAQPPRRIQPEPARPVPVNSGPKEKDQKGKKPGSRRSEAQAMGLRVIKGGKDKDPNAPDDDEAENQDKE